MAFLQIPRNTAPLVAARTAALSESVAALTTTFTAPAQCTAGSMTMLGAVADQIWLNEPEPVPGTSVTECYPPAFIDSYSSVNGSASSIAPLISPLVCPEDWVTASTYSSGYVACCASGYSLHPPRSNVDPDRPAYGGTCYSDLSLGQTVTVTVYDETALAGTSVWTATAATAQAYAHPIDGISLGYTPSTTGASGTATAGTGTATSTGSSAASSSSSAAATSSAAPLGLVHGLLISSLIAYAAM